MNLPSRKASFSADRSVRCPAYAREETAFRATPTRWSLIVIAIDVLIIYAIIAHGEELRTGEATPTVNS
jgi:hypothetical protein